VPIALVSSDNEKAWLHERTGNGRRVTKTDAVRLVGAGISTFKRIYAEKTGEQKFHGNAATERGHRLEPVVQSWVEANLGIPPCNILYANEDRPEHAATPDSAAEDDGEWSFVEIKTTTENWENGLPLKIIRDVLWQRHVLGAGYSAVAWWQVDEGGQPLTLEPQLIEVSDDPHRTRELIDGANAYLAWVDAGRPDTDESGVDLEVVEAIAAVNAGKAAEKMLRDRFERDGEALSVTTSVGSLKFTIAESTSFDKVAFLKANPESALIVAGADELLKNAQKDPEFRKPTVRTSLTIAPPKEEQEAA